MGGAGFRACVVCVEINFPHLFSEYERLGVECLLLSAYPVDTIFEVTARAHAAINAYWIALCVPAQTSHLMTSAVISPNGTYSAQSTSSALTLATLDRDAAEYQLPLTRARPWQPPPAKPPSTTPAE